MPALFASPLFHSGRQPSNSRSESKATTAATINSVNQAHISPPGSHSGEDQVECPRQVHRSEWMYDLQSRALWAPNFKAGGSRFELYLAYHQSPHLLFMRLV